MENRTKRIKLDHIKRKLIIDITLVKKIKIEEVEKQQEKQFRKYEDEMTWFRIYGG
jgi:hypothetical protein